MNLNKGFVNWLIPAFKKQNSILWQGKFLF